MDAAQPRPPTTEQEPFSVCDCDPYLAHLCAVSMQEQLVLAAEEVRNQFGILLLRQGTPLGSHALERVQGHRLNRPVDDVFTLRLTPDAETLASDILATAAADPDLASITTRFGLDEQVRHLCGTSGLPHALLQKLAVLRRALPRVHHRAMFTAWLGTALAAGRGLTEEESTWLLLAALLHDIGFLHMEPELSAQRGDITPADWGALQAHPERSADVIMQSWPEAPARVLRMVSEHHERHDGAGYPEGTDGTEQDPLSGIIGLADMLHALRFDVSADQVHSITDCLPFLRVNRRTWGIGNYRPAARILLAARDATPPAETGPAPSPQGLIDANRSLGEIITLIPTARAVLGSIGDNRKAHSLLQLLEELESTARAAGLGAQTLSAWLHDNLREGRNEPGMEDIALTIKESLWLVRRVDRQLRSLQQEQKRTPEASRLKDLSLRVRSELTRAWRRFEDRL